MQIRKSIENLAKRIMTPSEKASEGPVADQRFSEAVKKLAAGHVGKKIEVHYLDLGKPKISIRPLLETPNAEGMRLGEHLNHHWIWWDFTDPVSGRNFTVKRVKDAKGNLIFERKDVKFDEKNAQRI
ncbi:MAG: hypothetical protein WCX64_02600 [Candidatus Micrarchaeia archaeon]|jgi:hypothetical protein